MITILPADEAARRKLELNDPAVHAMVLDHRGEIGGYILFTIRDTEMELLQTDVKDMLLQEGLVRAALNYGFRRAVETARSKTPELHHVLTQLCFTEENGALSVSVPEFFQRGCRYSD